jgi:hypothetical protein
MGDDTQGIAAQFETSERFDKRLFLMCLPGLPGAFAIIL